MDKIQFVQGMYPEDIHFNGLQESAEEADKRLALSLAGAGIVSGFEVSVASVSAIISPGTGFDGLGRAVHGEEELSCDLSVITRPASGLYKWVAIFAAFSRNNYGSVYDDNNQRHDLYQDESLSVGIIQGVAGSMAGAIRPAVGNNILLADLFVDAATPFDALTLDFSRREHIPSVVSLKKREQTHRVTIDCLGEMQVPFAQLGLTNGSYSVRSQIVGNKAFVRSLGLDVDESCITLYLYHDTYPYSIPTLGAPLVKVGSAAVGVFKIGSRDSIPVDLFIRKEDL